MTPLHKEGLYWLILLAATAATYAVLAVFAGPIAAFGAFGFLGLSGFLPLLYRRRPEAVVMDERDQQIALRAQMAGYSVFWLAFTLGVMSLWAVLFWRKQEMVSIHTLPLIVMGGTAIFATARAVAILVQYRLQAGKEE